jgi:hypothetical protein
MERGQINAMKAKYAKNKVACKIQGDGQGFKLAAHRLCEYVGMRWSNREHAYIASPEQLSDAQTLLACGYDASPILGEIIRPAIEVGESSKRLRAASNAGIGGVSPLTIARAEAREIADARERRRIRKNS